MLGNWSLGSYFKTESIEYSFEFLTKTLGIPLDMLSFTCFKGDKDAPADNEAAEKWKNLGVKEDRIAFLPKEDNWWGPAGKTGPCGPDTEIFFWVGTGKAHGNPGINPKEWAEIWNNVFMQYDKQENGSFQELKQKNIDTGMGVERTLAILNKCNSVYETDSLFPLIKKAEELSGKKYNDETGKSMRIIADHIRSSVVLLAELVAPSNVEQGYVLRRLIRRAVRHGRTLGIAGNFTHIIAEEVFKIYPDYSHMQKNKEFIIKELKGEEERFSEVLEKGIRYFDRLKETIKGKVIDGKTAFLMYQSCGFPIEMTQELAKENGFEVDILGFEQEQAMHQELSRTATEGKFKSGLADNSEATTKLHTATHLLDTALRQVLGSHVEQRGSNITAERLRFDFSHDEKMTPEQIKEVEKIVNENIKKQLDVKREEMTVDEAKKLGAIGVFEHKYGEKVSVYAICDPKNVYSREICAGPHVQNTKELGKFKIQKEEASSKGVRRIKAILESN